MESEFTTLKGLSEPSRRALASAGLANLADLQNVTEKELSKLHGMGPKALRVLSEALASKGMAFEIRRDSQD